MRQLTGPREYQRRVRFLARIIAAADQWTKTDEIIARAEPNASQRLIADAIEAAIGIQERELEDVRRSFARRQVRVAELRDELQDRRWPVLRVVGTLE